MRYYLISDIHANIEALDAVLGAIAKETPGQYLCLGDVIGYGAEPGEAIRIVRSLAPRAAVAGNHEWGAAGIFDLGYFNDDARDALIWTKNLLAEPDLDYLKTFDLTYKGKDFTLVHGSLDEPGSFNYIFNASDAYETMEFSSTPLVFVGHSHVAGIYSLKDGRAVRSREHKIKIDYDGKYVINVGSVGQPRDGDPKAAYAVYDEEEGSVEIKRVGYDIRSAQKKILDAGLPKSLAARLSEGR